MTTVGRIHGPSASRYTRGASVLRANAVIIHARRLATVIATYRDALDRDDRRADRERSRSSF